MLCVQWKAPDDGQRNCPKHVEFYSKNILDKLVHLVGFIIRIYHDARSAERHIFRNVFEKWQKKKTFFNFVSDIFYFLVQCIDIKNS